MLDKKRQQIQLTQLIKARAAFDHALGRFAKVTGQAGNVDILHRTYAYYIAEFYTLLELNDVATAQKFTGLIEGHNKAIDDLLQLEAREIYEQVGLTPSTLRYARFTDKEKKRACELFDINCIIETSDLARFLYRHMSRETCRNCINAMGRVELLSINSIGIAYPQQLIQLFLNYLDMVALNATTSD